MDSDTDQGTAPPEPAPPAAATEAAAFVLGAGRKPGEHPPTSKAIDELVAFARAGDQLALDAVYRETAGRLYPNADAVTYVRFEQAQRRLNAEVSL